MLYDTQDKAQEVTYVINHWEDYSIMSHDSDRNNYRSSADYFTDMLKFDTYGGLCELVAAGQLFLVFIEMYLNGELYEKFGSERNPIKRFRFNSKQNLSNGHFDVYLPYEDELTTSVSDEFDNRSILKNDGRDLQIISEKNSLYNLLLNISSKIKKFIK